MLKLENVDAGYGDVTVLRDVNLCIGKASVVALLGANGSGKTTVCDIVSGILRPKCGRVIMNSRDLTKSPPSSRVAAGICHIPGEGGVFPNLTVRDNLRVFSMRGGEIEGVGSALDAFPVLGDRLDQLAATLSGGEQRMLALARAYVQQPDLVLVDEVSMGLSPLLVERVYTFLQQLANDGFALLLVEQFVHRALGLADYVYILNRGRVAFEGKPAELEGKDLFGIGVLGEEVAGKIGPG